MPLNLYLFGAGLDAILVIGGIHGNEPSSAALARRLYEELSDQPDLAGSRLVGVLPAANPDGLAAERRGNADGVDLNRNFPAKNWRAGVAGYGPQPASEPETLAILKAFELLQPARVLAIHACGRGRHCNNFDGPAQALAERMSRENQYPARASMGYATPGSLGSWAGVDRRIPVITLELPRDLSPEECWRQNRGALLTFIRGE